MNLNLIEQLNTEFDRIWELIENKRQLQSVITAQVLFIATKPDDLDDIIFHIATKPDDLNNKSWIRFNKLETNLKREILAAIFTAKDENVEYVLREGDKPNPDKNDFLESENHPFESSYELISTLEAIGAEFKPDNLRGLFLQNCFGQTQDEIDNLKLINW